MRIGELSRQSGAPVATIKYYLREGLLPPGRHTSANQVDYGTDHLRRLRLLRALIGLGGLSVRAARSVLSRLAADPGMPLFTAMGKAQYSLLDPDFDQHAPQGRDTPGGTEVDQLVARMGWSVGPHNPARQALADELAEVRRLGHHDLADRLERYADIAGRLAELDIDLMLNPPAGDPVEKPEEAAERVIVLTVMGDRLVTALRRLAHENAAARRLHPPERKPLPPEPDAAG